MKIEKLLFEDEKILFKASQSRVKPGGSPVTPDTIIVTNKRVIIVNPSWLGLHKKIESYPYSKIFGVQLVKGVFSSTIILKIPGVSDTSGTMFFEEAQINALPKKKAKEIYNYILKQIEGHTWM